MTYVFDACALIAFLDGEEGKDAVKDILKQAIDEKETLVYISAVNLVEVYYGYIRDLGREKALVILEKIYAVPVKIIETATKPVYLEASRLKATYKMALGDAIGLATAINLNGVFVTSDGELAEPEAREHAPIFWFRPPKPKK
ncbi:MAG: type II toxin-antitoxin system VapC family toxin [Treponema sp.]|jgi:predicted nucleic acid-binding protein|nr:type II toxin-antitoxin system VapC family toxin [Treponema sp.]